MVINIIANIEILKIAFTAYWYDYKGQARIRSLGSVMMQIDFDIDNVILRFVGLSWRARAARSECAGPGLHCVSSFQFPMYMYTGPGMKKHRPSAQTKVDKLNKLLLLKQIFLIKVHKITPLSAPGANCVPGANTHLRQLLFRRFCRLETFSNPFTIYCLSK